MVSVLFQMVWSGCDVSVSANGVHSVSDGLVWLRCFCHCSQCLFCFRWPGLGVMFLSLLMAQWCPFCFRWSGLAAMFLSLLMVSILFQMVWSGCGLSVIANGVCSVSDGLVWLRCFCHC